MVAFTKHDLQFILDGIVVSETHADQTNDITGNVWTPADIDVSRQVLLDLVPNSFEPIGMRTISGELNNLIIGQEDFGATGEFPRLTDPSFRDDGATGNPLDGTAFGPGTNTDYSDPGTVVDSDPRIISNLIVDQSVRNPAAIAAAEAAPGTDGLWGSSDDVLGDGVSVINPDGIAGTGDEFFKINNVAPDEGLSAPFNSWFTFFGQFFDHGLDLIKRGDEKVFIPLQPDDPLVLFGPDGIAGTGDEVAAGTPQIISRVDVDPGLDGILGTDDDSQPINLTSPFVDQNQTYTSHPSHQLFMREYEAGPNGPVATGKMIEGAAGSLASWGEVKVQAATLLGIELTDVEGIDIPLFAVDQYGEFLRGPNGLPQFVMSDGSLVEGNLTTPVSVAAAELATGLTVQRTGFSFLVDIAHEANPVDGSTGLFLTRHEDGDPEGGTPLLPGEYDGDLFDAHLLSGDGRSNENFGLTTVHHVFHSEHNRLVDHTKDVLVTASGSGDIANAIELLNGYLETDVATFSFVDRADFAAGAAGDTAFDAAVQVAVDSLTWDGDRIFQAAKFATEMQYQHLVFEEFARKVQPLVDIFATFEGTVDAKIVAEFAHTVYRFGHSMLNEDVDLIDSNGDLTQIGLIDAFLNPLGFHQDVQSDGTVISGNALDPEAFTGALIRGMTRQTGNEIDEFVTEALRNNLLGLPLDLPAINIARGRETGIPTLNQARAEFFEGTSDTKLKPYDSWVDFAGHLKHEESIINFIASYGQHIDITSATTLADKRDAALAIATGGLGAPADRLDFLNSTGAWATQETGLNLVDFWIGGLAEATEPFGGLLGSTFNFVFEHQLEALQDGDRFYYLGRTAGLNFVTQLEQNSFAALIIRNTDLGDGPGDHLPGDIFSVPNYILEIDESLQITNLDTDGVTELVGGRTDPNDPSPVLNIPLVIRDNPNTAADEDALNTYLHYTGGDHVVLGGSAADDTIIGGIGDDTIWGDDGDDNLEGGDGADIILGGEGDDVITDIGGPNNLQGQGGNDAISASGGESLILAGDGKDFVLQGPDLAETFGGNGDDFINAGSESNIIFGGEGSDWLEAGGGANLLIGDNGDPFLNSTIIGHDVFIPGLGDDDYDAESGDDIMLGGIGIQRFEGTNGFDWATYFRDESGVDVDMQVRAFDETPIPPSPATIQDRFAEVEGLSGSAFTDILRGEDTDGIANRNANNGGDNVLRNFDLIQGLREGDFGGIFDATALFAASQTEWGEGDIILGGGGSDLIEGRGGDDIIDGDLALGVRLLVRDPVTDVPIATADAMQGQLFQVDANGDPVLVAGERVPISVGGFDTLNDAIFNRAINPGNLHILREIIDDSAASDFDTAQFNDIRANYTIDLTPDAQGFISVTHNGVGNGATGSDLLRGIERLQFTDQSITIAGSNNEPTGQPVIVDPGTTTAVTDPGVGDQVEASLGTLADLDGLPILTSQFSFIWQVEEDPGTGVFIDLEIINTGGDAGPLTGTVVTVPPEAAGLALRVKVIYQDGNGVIETVHSNPTDTIGGLAVTLPTNGDDTLNGTANGETIEGLAGDDIISAGAGNDILIGGDDATIPNPPGVPNLATSNNAGNDILDGGAGIDTARFFGPRSDFDFVLDVDGNLEVVEIASGEEDLILNIEFLQFDDVVVTFADAFASAGGGATAGDDVLNGTPGNDLIDGLAGNDLIRGFGGDDELIGGLGNDDLRGNAGADILDGGEGADILRGGGGGDDLTGGLGDDDIRAGGGADTIFWEARSATDTDGRDVVDGGGGGADRLRIRGSADDETYFIETRTDYLARKGGAAESLAPASDIIVSRTTGAVGTDTVITELDRIEDIDINGGGGNDTFVVSGDFTGTNLDPNTITITGSDGDDTLDVTGLESDHHVVFNLNGGNDMVVGNANVTTHISGGDTSGDTGGGNNGGGNGAGIEFSADDIAELKNLVNGLPSENLEDTVGGTGVRDLEGTGNNVANPDFGTADQDYLRLTEAHYGDLDGNGNRDIDVIHHGLDAREISNILATQEDGLPKAETANVFINAFGQYFDHGLDFLLKGGSGTIAIGSGPNSPADLTRGTAVIDANGVPQHINNTSPFVDQNQAYGSTEVVGQFVRDSDGNQGYGARLFAGEPDPGNPEYNLLPTLAALVKHHWEADTVFEDAGKGVASTTLRQAYAGLVDDTTGDIDTNVLDGLVANFLGSGHAIFVDINPFIPLEDHLVAGDGRANENVTLTSIHTVWAREHNSLVERLQDAGFTGSPEEVFQAAKIVNVAQYQRVVYDEYADAILGGLPGSGEHSFDDYNPDVDAGISHEFAAAAFRFGHSMLADDVTILDENGVPQQVPLFDLFLNPGAVVDTGIARIIGGIVTQPAEEVDENVVDAVRDDLVRTHADLEAFGIARGWDVGLGTLNQVRHDLMTSNDPYIMEAVDRAGGLDAYESWEDFQDQNGLSDEVIAQFQQAYPDLDLDTLSQADRDSFFASNSGIALVDGHIVKGIDRVDLFVGGMAEEHIRGGVVGSTFWAIIFNQFDRLQEGDRFYYLDRNKDFDFYDFIEDQSFSDIIARNTGLTGLPENIFEVSDTVPDANTTSDTGDTGDDTGDDTTPMNLAPIVGSQVNLGDLITNMTMTVSFVILLNQLLAGASDADGPSALTVEDLQLAAGSGGTLVDNGDGTWTYTANIGDISEANFTYRISDGVDSTVQAASLGLLTDQGAAEAIDGTSEANSLVGTEGLDLISGHGAADLIAGLGGDDIIDGGEGNDNIVGGDGNDLIFGGDGNDRIFGNDGDDMIFGDDGDDRIFGDDGDDVIEGGAGSDTINAGGEDDIVLATFNDGDDIYLGGSGTDTYDLSGTTDDALVNLMTGFASSAQTGSDALSGFENVVGSFGDDQITANASANVMTGGLGNDTFIFGSVAAADGDRITDFQPGDKIDVSAIGGASDPLTLVSALTDAGQIMFGFTNDNGTDLTLVQGNINGGSGTDFTIEITGQITLTVNDFLGVV